MTKSNHLVLQQLLTAKLAVTAGLVLRADAFLKAKRAEGVSPKTVIAYTEAVKKLLDWCENRGVTRVEELTAPLLREYLLWLEEAGHNPGGVHRFYRVMKTFLRWYEREEE